MADQGLFDKTTQTAREAGDYLRINRPYAPNPSGRADYKIEADNFLSPEQARLTANEANITSLDGRVTIIENNSTKTLYEDIVTDFTFTQGEDEHIQRAVFFRVGGSPTVAIGTTLGGDDLLSSRVISDLYRGLETVVYPEQAGRTIYVSISGGTVDLVVYKQTNVFEL